MQAGSHIYQALEYCGLISQSEARIVTWWPITSLRCCLMLCRGQPLTRIHYLWAWSAHTRVLHMTKILAEKWPKSAGYCTSNDAKHVQKTHSNPRSSKLKPADVKQFLVFSHVGLRNICEPEIFETFYKWVEVWVCRRYLTKCLDLPLNILTDLTYCYQTHSCQILTFDNFQRWQASISWIL